MAISLSDVNWNELKPSEYRNSPELLKEVYLKIAELEEFVKRVQEAPTFFSTVVLTDPVTKTIILTTSTDEVVCVKQPDFKLETGDRVNVNTSTGQIVKASDLTNDIQSKISKVIEVLSPGKVLLNSGELSASKIAYVKNGVIVEVGDRVTTDTHSRVVLSVIPENKKKLDYDNSVTWDDVVGLEDVKLQLKEMIEMPVTHGALFKKYGYKPPRGVLFSGPPGCGKTMLGKAVASSISKMYGDNSPNGFIYVKGPELLSKFVGESESSVRELFARAASHKKKTGAPAVIFIDEADAVLSSRYSGNQSISGMEKTMVPAFLAEMDGIGEHNAFVILATNRPEVLDNAVVRDGRIDRKIRVTRPNSKMIEDIVSKNLNGCPLTDDITPSIVSEMMVESGTYEIFSSKLDGSPQYHVMNMMDFVSGAMVYNITRRAKSFAMHEELDGKEGAVSNRHLILAVDATLKELKGINHNEEIRDFMLIKGLSTYNSIRSLV